MLFNLVPEEVFLQPVQRIPPQMRCRRQVPDMEFLRRLGLAPLMRRPSGACRGQMPSDCCPILANKTTGCCKPPASTKRGDTMVRGKQTVEKALDFRGFSPEQIQVKVTDKSVMVRGEQKNDHTHVQITKSVPLPEGADKKGVVCRYENGFVTVHVPGAVEKSTEKSQGEVDGQKENAEMDARRKAEFERSVNTLTDLFSTLFGVHLDDSTPEKEDEDAEQKNEAEQRTNEGEKIEVEKKDEDCNAERHGATSERKPQEVEKESGKEEKDNYDAEVTTPCNTSSTTSCPDKDQTCVLRVDVVKSKENEEDGFVHLEKQEADGKLEKQEAADKPADDETGTSEENVNERVTSSLGDDVKEADDNTEDEVVEASEHSEVSKPTPPEVFKLELDLSNYRPEKIRVVFKDGDVIVEAEREIKRDGYSETEKLHKQIRVPETVEESKLQSFLNSEGLLTVRAPYKDVDSS